MSNDPTSSAEGPLVLAPYQVEPFLAQFEKGVNEVVIMGIEQLGKSLIWKAGNLYRLENMREGMMIVYENDEKAEDINKESWHPMLMAIPKYKKILETNKRSFKGRQYNLNGQIIDFCGAGSDQTSKTLAYITGDETDTWPLTPSKRRSQVENLRKRMRRFLNSGVGCLTLCSSPKGTYQESTIWSRFVLASQNYFHLRCLGCNELTIPSKDINLIQYEVKDGQVQECTINCPHCGYTHHEEDAVQMSGEGGYIEIERGSYADSRKAYQFGGLANPAVFRWRDLAGTIEQYKDTKDVEELRTLYNSFYGVPLEIEINTNQRETIMDHIGELPDDSEIKFTVLGIDTQVSPAGFYYARRAFDEDLNSYLVQYGFVHTEEEILKLIKHNYKGNKNKYTIMDVRGDPEKAKRVLGKAKALGENILGYQGVGHGKNKLKRYQYHPEDRRIVQFDAKACDLELLKAIYEDIDRSSNYWYLPDERTGRRIGDGCEYKTYLRHIMSYKPNPRKGEIGDILENWTPNNARCDLFDCEKMILCIIELFGDKLLKNQSNKPKKQDTSIKKGNTFINPGGTSNNWLNGWS